MLLKPQKIVNVYVYIHIWIDFKDDNGLSFFMLKSYIYHYPNRTHCICSEHFAHYFEDSHQSIV